MSAAGAKLLDLRPLGLALREAEKRQRLRGAIDLRPQTQLQSLAVTPAHPIRQTSRRRRFRLKWHWTYGFAVRAVAASVMLLTSALLTTGHMNPEAMSQSPPPEADQIGPAPQASPTMHSAAVPAPPPRPVDRLAIPAIGVNAQAIKVGLTKDGGMDTPDSLWVVGLFSKGARPGDTGAVIIDGHSGIPGQYLGVFSNLSRIKSGQTITFTYDSSQVFTYKVTSSHTASADQATAQAFFAPTSQKLLRLISCYGSHDRQDNFSQRWIVEAIQV